MRSFIAAMKLIPDDIRALVAALILVVIGVGVLAPMVAVATPTKTPRIVIAVVKDQSRLFTGDAVAHVDISELFCKLSCDPLNDRIVPTKIKTVTYRKEDAETIRATVQNQKPVVTKQQKKRQ